MMNVLTFTAYMCQYVSKLWNWYVKNVIRIFQTKTVQNSEIIYLRIGSNCSRRRALHFNERALCLTKGHLDNPGQVKVEYLLIESNFWQVSFILRKIFFFKKGTFNEAFNPQTLYLSKIGPGCFVSHSQ